ncbi:MAG: UDP-N-acetylmuramoyl-L-alanine--D-glutamate ligase, partial [Tissierellia bacterium]|nr:UDP-N-acetylmuramoyl-L-alanine--D-glutamate ligase [Tissierellia bacterium]
HKTVDNYMNAKMKIIKNQDENDYIVLNWDDAHLREVDTSNVNTIKCSILDELEEGIFLKNDKIVYKNGSLEIEVIDTTKVKLLGKHNIYNIMFVVAVSVIMKIDLNKMAETIYNFQGLEHRLEFVKNISGVNYYNDSKGTNPDSTIKAIDAVEENIVIILGGYDKKIDFTELLEYSKDKVKAIVTVGETKYKIYNKALELGYEEVYVAEEFKEAVLKCKEIAQSGDTVLLSPASASWGMFKSYEERGNEFKSIVNSLEGN